MAVNVYATVLDPIKFALTTGKNKTPISAAPLSRVKLELLDRATDLVVDTVDSSIDSDVFFWDRTEETVKGVSVFLLEMELHNSSLTIKEDMIARLTIYDGANPLGLPWKQFALNSR